MTVSKSMRMQQGSLTLVALVFLLAACSTASDTIVTEEIVAAEEAVEEEAPAEITYSRPTDCTSLLDDAGLALLAPGGLELIAGPGSPSNDPIYVEGQTPEELVGGLSCLYAVPGEVDTGINIILGTASVDAAIRPTVIDDLLAQQLNVGQTADGALTYWKWGDEVIVPAIHNSLYTDSWYSALIQPGGRESYDLGVALVQAMRTQTTQ
ncbi:MAG: hypothetical protein K9G03_02465 [Pontimonas sp.]|nr:hypothetical protein [Pontimonas sp.]